MNTPAMTLDFPHYSAENIGSLRIPDITDTTITGILADYWEATRHEIVPQYRDGYTAVRRAWDEAVSEALGWDIEKIACLGEQLANEPRVRGIARGQWKA